MSLTTPPAVIEKGDTRWYEISHPVTGERHLLHSVTTIQHRVAVVFMRSNIHVNM